MVYRVLIPTDGYRIIVVFSAIASLIKYGCGPSSHFGVIIAVNINRSATKVSKNQAKLRHVITT